MTRYERQTEILPDVYRVETLDPWDVLSAEIKTLVDDRAEEAKQEIADMVLNFRYQNRCDASDDAKLAVLRELEAQRSYYLAQQMQNQANALNEHGRPQGGLGISNLLGGLAGW